MTQKETADELFGKFAMYLRANLLYDEEANEDAKQCALIAVDEILMVLQQGHPTEIVLMPMDLIDYWINVKKEIENL